MADEPVGLGMTNVSCGEGGLSFQIAHPSSSNGETESLTMRHIEINGKETKCNCDLAWVPEMQNILKDTRRDLDIIMAESNPMPIRRSILMTVPQIPARSRQPVGCIPRFLRNDEVSGVKGNLFVCANIQRTTGVYGCYLSELAKATGINLSTFRSRMRALVAELRVDKRCVFPKDKDRKIIIPFDLLPDLLKISEQTNLGFADFIMQAVNYYWRFYVTDKGMSMNTVRFVILSLKNQCMFSNLSNSYQRLARAQEMQHKLIDSLSQQNERLEKRVSQHDFDLYSTNNQIRELTACVASLLTRDQYQSDLLCTILNRTKFHAGQKVFGRLKPKSDEDRAMQNFATLLHDRFQTMTSNTSVASQAMEAALADVAKMPPKDEETDVSTAKVLEQNGRQIAKALGRKNVSIGPMGKKIANHMDTFKRQAAQDAKNPKPAKRQKPLNT